MNKQQEEWHVCDKMAPTRRRDCFPALFFLIICLFGSLLPISCCQYEDVPPNTCGLDHVQTIGLGVPYIDPSSNLWPQSVCVIGTIWHLSQHLVRYLITHGLQAQSAWYHFLCLNFTWQFLVVCLNKWRVSNAVCLDRTCQQKLPWGRFFSDSGRKRWKKN